MLLVMTAMLRCVHVHCNGQGEVLAVSGWLQSCGLTVQHNSGQQFLQHRMFLVKLRAVP